MLPSERFSSLLMPFRSSPASPQLPEGYRLAQSPGTDLADGSERAAASRRIILRALDGLPQRRIPPRDDALHLLRIAPEGRRTLAGIEHA